MFKKYSKAAVCLLMAGSLAACSSTVPEATEAPEETPAVETTPESSETPEAGSNEFVLTGEVTEPVVIDTDQDVTITLRDVKAEMEDSFIKVDNAASVTMVVEGNNDIKVSGEEIKAINSSSDLTITGEGTLRITSDDSCIKTDGNLIVESGTFELTCGDDGDGLRADEALTINDGNFNIRAGECIEATVVEINGGELNLSSADDAINASEKSASGLTPTFIMNGGKLFIEMDGGDTDGIDSNGDIEINGGEIEVYAISAFDWDGKLIWNDGAVIVNGEEVTEIQNSAGDIGMMHGEMPGPMFNGEKPEFPEEEHPKMSEGPTGRPEGRQGEGPGEPVESPKSAE